MAYHIRIESDQNEAVALEYETESFYLITETEEDGVHTEHRGNEFKMLGWLDWAREMQNIIIMSPDEDTFSEPSEL